MNGYLQGKYLLGYKLLISNQIHVLESARTSYMVPSAKTLQSSYSREDSGMGTYEAKDTNPNGSSEILS
jgi:hypothetical protein